MTSRQERHENAFHEIRDDRLVEDAIALTVSAASIAAIAVLRKGANGREAVT